jgi:hypothetical protein
MCHWQSSAEPCELPAKSCSETLLSRHEIASSFTSYRPNSDSLELDMTFFILFFERFSVSHRTFETRKTLSAQVIRGHPRRTGTWSEEMPEMPDAADVDTGPL